MIQLKISQGAKPGIGGHLPGSKVTPEIADVRKVQVGKTPFTDEHLEFSDGVQKFEDLKPLLF